MKDNNSFINVSEDTDNTNSVSSRLNDDKAPEKSQTGKCADNQICDKMSKVANDNPQIKETKSSSKQLAKQKGIHIQINCLLKRLHKKMQDPAIALVIAILTLLIALYGIYRPELFNREGTNLQNGDMIIMTTNGEEASYVTDESSGLPKDEVDNESSYVTDESSGLPKNEGDDEAVALDISNTEEIRWAYGGTPIKLYYKESDPLIKSWIYYDYEKEINLLDFYITLKKEELDYNKMVWFYRYNLPIEEGFPPTIYLSANLLPNNTIECVWTRYRDENFKTHELIERPSGYILSKENPYLDYFIDITNLLTDTAYYSLNISCDYLENGNNHSINLDTITFIYVDMEESEFLEFYKSVQTY